MTTATKTITPLICSECGRGHYVAMYGETARCSECSHKVYVRSDITPYLEDGEGLMTRNGLLHLVTTD